MMASTAAITVGSPDGVLPAEPGSDTAHALLVDLEEQLVEVAALIALMEEQLTPSDAAVRPAAASPAQLPDQASAPW